MLFSLWRNQKSENPAQTGDDDPAAPNPAASVLDASPQKEAKDESLVEDLILGRKKIQPICSSEEGQTPTAGMQKSVATQTDIDFSAVATSRSPAPLLGDPRKQTQTDRHLAPQQRNAAQGYVVAESQRSRPHKQTTPSERLSAWYAFTEQNHDLLRKRVQADDYRRRAGFARSNFMQHAISFPVILRQAGKAADPNLLELVAVLERHLKQAESADRQVEELEDGLVQAESTIAKTLPRVLGLDNAQTFYMLEEERLYLRPPSAPSTDSGSGHHPAEQELSSEQQRFYAILDKVDLLEEQLLELQEIRSRLDVQTETELDTKAKAFLRSYDEENRRLSKELEDARLDLELVRDVLQPLPVSDDEGGYSDTASTQPQASSPAAVTSISQSLTPQP